MTEFIIIAILIILFGGFLYWAYLPDYRRNSKEFWRILIGMPIGMLLGGIGYKNLYDKIRKWTLSEENKKEPDE